MESSTWFRFLSRWGLLLPIVFIGLVVSFFAAIGSVAGRPLADAYPELIAAAYAPGVYRIATLFDAAGWIVIGGLIFGIAMSAVRVAPRRALLAAPLAVTMVVGVLGAFMRLVVTGSLGARLADGEDQVTIVNAYRLLDGIIGAHFLAGDLLQGAALVIAASAALAMAGFPRRPAYLLAVSGAASLLLFAVQIVANVFLFPLLLIDITVLAVASSWLALAVRRLSSPVSAVAQAGI
jgi:hypothetical protein